MKVHSNLNTVWRDAYDNNANPFLPQHVSEAENGAERPEKGVKWERSGEQTFQKKTLERGRSVKRETAKRGACVTNICLTTERQIGRSRSAHML